MELLQIQMKETNKYNRICAADLEIEEVDIETESLPLYDTISPKKTYIKLCK